MIENKPFVLYAECVVKYEGRAKSETLKGNRLIIFKPDKTLLVHKAKGIPPLNYNRAKEIIISDNKIISNGKEKIEIVIEKIHSIMYLDQWSEENTSLTGSEADYVNYLITNINNFIPNIKEIKREYSTNAGKIDLCAIDTEDKKHLIEVKRKRATISNIYQLLRYYRNTDGDKFYIAAPSINERAQKELEKYNFNYIKLKL